MGKEKYYEHKGMQKILFPFKIRVYGKQYSGAAFGEEMLEEMKDKIREGNSVILKFYRKGNFDNFKLPSQADLLEFRIQRLEKAMNIVCEFDKNLKDEIKKRC